MSEHGHALPPTPVSQVILAILGALVAPTLILVLIAKLFMSINATHLEDADPVAAADSSIEERIKPVAMVEVAAVESGPHVDKSGEEVVTGVCAACHSSGALGSPKIGDKSAWGPRIAQGYETLIKHAIAGLRSMPPRGGNPDLTDGEIANAIAYMANQSGANFTPPAAGAVAPEAAPVEAAPAATPAPTAAAVPAPAATPAKAAPVVAAAPAAKAEEEAKPAAVAEAEKPAAAAGKSGEQVVKSVCIMCHGTGLMGAPKIGDAAGWAPRIEQGYDTLVQHANNGVRMMPAKGGNSALSDQEVARAVAYMANQSGAKFTEPK